MQNMNNQNSQMEQYFCSLPKFVQESMKQSGVEFCDVAQMKAFVDNLSTKNYPQQRGPFGPDFIIWFYLVLEGFLPPHAAKSTGLTWQQRRTLGKGKIRFGFNGS